MNQRVCVLVVLAASACGDDKVMIDARPIDMPILHDGHDAGPCGAGRFVTGELVDLDSTSANFKGINAARLTVQGSTLPAETDTTSPNGRFELCAPAGTGPVVLDLVANANVSPKYHDGFVYLEHDVIAATTQVAGLRAFDEARRFTFYTERGLAYDVTKAHVLVWAGGDRTAINLDRQHDTPQAASDDATAGTFVWANGNTGRYVLFANVDVANPTGILSGDLSNGPHTIPLAANKLTLVGLRWGVGP